jgi:hypothetical protein
MKLKLYRPLFFTLFILCILAGCFCRTAQKKSTERSFYYWKTTYDFNETEEACADSLQLHHMYVRCFDIDWSENASMPVPAGMMYTSGYMHVPFASVTPCIYITNAVMEKCSQEELKDLAIKISDRLDKILTGFAASYAQTKTKKMRDSANSSLNDYSQKEQIALLNRTDKAIKDEEKAWLQRSAEVQVDCDWTEKTKENYFYFLKQMKRLIPDKTISCTLRLWQYANPEKAGTPPADRCMLMCYSTGSPKKYEGKNSISSAADLESYLSDKSYSLPLDIGIPVFGWAVLFRNGHFKGILHNADEATIKNDTVNFNHQYENYYCVLTDTVIENTYVRYGDEIKFESISNEELGKITDMISDNVELSEGSRIAFFSWDTTYIRQYGINNLETYYNRFQ